MSDNYADSAILIPFPDLKWHAIDDVLNRLSEYAYLSAGFDRQLAQLNQSRRPSPLSKNSDSNVDQFDPLPTPNTVLYATYIQQINIGSVNQEVSFEEFSRRHKTNYCADKKGYYFERLKNAVLDKQFEIWNWKEEVVTHPRRLSQEDAVNRRNWSDAPQGTPVGKSAVDQYSEYLLLWGRHHLRRKDLELFCENQNIEIFFEKIHTPAPIAQDTATAVEASPDSIEDASGNEASNVPFPTSTFAPVEVSLEDTPLRKTFDPASIAQYVVNWHMDEKRWPEDLKRIETEIGQLTLLTARKLQDEYGWNKPTPSKVMRVLAELCGSKYFPRIKGIKKSDGKIKGIVITAEEDESEDVYDAPRCRSNLHRWWPKIAKKP